MHSDNQNFLRGNVNDEATAFPRKPSVYVSLFTSMYTPLLRPFVRRRRTIAVRGLWFNDGQLLQERVLHTLRRPPMNRSLPEEGRGPAVLGGGGPAVAAFPVGGAVDGDARSVAQNPAAAAARARPVAQLLALQRHFAQVQFKSEVLRVLEVRVRTAREVQPLVALRKKPSIDRDESCHLQRDRSRQNRLLNDRFGR